MTKNPFWTSPTYQIIQAIQAHKDGPGIVQQWKNCVQAWAEANRSSPDAQAVLTWLPLWEVRPYYTAEELAPIFPVLAMALGFSERPTQYKSAKRLAHELDYGRLPSFEMQGKRYYLVERTHKWKEICTI